MRIINQRRDRSVNFDNVEIHADGMRIFAESDRKILLGEYDTEERASEVFEEIHKAYKSYANKKKSANSMGEYWFHRPNKTELSAVRFRLSPRGLIAQLGEHSANMYV